MNFIIHLLILFPLLFQTACAQKQANSDSIEIKTNSSDSIKKAFDAQIAATAKQMTEAEITHFIIHAPEGKFGYTIFIDGQMYIEQKNIPSIAGNAGFASKEEAEKIAQLVITKMRKGEMPPSITLEDLQSNGITY